MKHYIVTNLLVRIPTIGIFFALFSSCNTPKQLSVNPTIESFLQHEWVSFCVRTDFYDDHNLDFNRFDAEVIVHNGSDSAKHEITVINSDGDIYHLTPNKVTYISPNYLEYAIYTKEDRHYETFAMDAMQDAMDYFPMYYDCNYSSMININKYAHDYIIEEEDTLYAFAATKTEKYCYTNGTCRLKDAPITLYYSTTNQCFVRAIQTIRKKPTEWKYISSICKISYDDRSEYIDSLLDFGKMHFSSYSMFTGDKYLLSRTTTKNTSATEEVVNYPIVNLETGDTTNIEAINGSILLCYFNFFTLNNERYSKIESIADAVDNIIWIFPNCSNKEKIAELAERERVGNNVYYAKALQTELSDFNRFYLFDKNHKIVSFYDGGDFKKWFDESQKSTKK